MSNKKYPWLRLYTEMVDDEKLRLLAFEDRWHYVALLCMKGSGILDDDCSHDLKMRRVAVKMGLSVRELDEVARRLSEVDLVCRDTLHPHGWEDRQFQSDSSSDRVRAYRDRKKLASKSDETLPKRSCDVIEEDTDTETDISTEVDKENTTPSGKPDRRGLLQILLGHGVSNQIAADFLAQRKAAKVPLSVAALDIIRKEADKAGYTLEMALSECLLRGWRGFKADWVLKDKQVPAGGSKPAKVNQLPTDYGKGGRL